MPSPCQYKCQYTLTHFRLRFFLSSHHSVPDNAHTHNVINIHKTLLCTSILLPLTSTKTITNCMIISNSVCVRMWGDIVAIFNTNNQYISVFWLPLLLPLNWPEQTTTWLKYVWYKCSEETTKIVIINISYRSKRYSYLKHNVHRYILSHTHTHTLLISGYGYGHSYGEWLPRLSTYSSKQTTGSLANRQTDSPSARLGDPYEMFLS